MPSETQRLKLIEEQRSMEHEADALVFRILLKRAQAIEDRLDAEPDSSLSPTDLGALKELRKLAAESREQRKADEAELAERESEVQSDPLALELGEALLHGTMPDCFAVIEKLGQRGDPLRPELQLDLADAAVALRKALGRPIPDAHVLE